MPFAMDPIFRNLSFMSLFPIPNPNPSKFPIRFSPLLHQANCTENIYSNVLLNVITIMTSTSNMQRNYLKWSNSMDRALASCLYDQMNLGNRSDHGWKPITYRVCVDKLNVMFNIQMEVQNIKNRLKAWKKHHTIVSDIIKQSGFTWDDHRKMVIVGDNAAWTAYCESHNEATPYKDKVIDNWDDIVALCGMDKATVVETEDVNEASTALRDKALAVRNSVHSSMGLYNSETAEGRSTSPSTSQTGEAPSNESTPTKLCVMTSKFSKQRNYIKWSNSMDRALASCLYDQMNIGNRSDYGWKPITYRVCVDKLNIMFNIQMEAHNIKNRLKAWKKHYSIVSDIIKQSGFTWDDRKKMIVVEDNTLWTAYCESHNEATPYKDKVIDNWDDIVTLCGNDKATVVETEDVNEASRGLRNEALAVRNFIHSSMGLDNCDTAEGRSTSASTSRTREGPSNASTPNHKKKKKDQITTAISEMAASVQKCMAANEKFLQATMQVIMQAMNPPKREVRDFVFSLEWIPEEEKYDVYDRLVKIDLEEFHMLQELSDEKRRGWIRHLCRRPPN
ncbi:uncharacterized protein LOC143848211 isoform X2 [Tasmannia lanceolata]|uniref:uncharacterized protein LOC143848211 isoform X2 n=1 Tax=Tasmannia lanceolata TaxID=3420 RepID=UPI004062D715